jgi:hypothetical protein
MPVWADIPPPPGYVEKCSVEIQQKSGEECRLCGASFQGRGDCQKLASQGYSERCRSAGASVWQEVWCRVRPKPDRKAALDGVLPGKLVAGGSLTLAVIFGGVWAARKVKGKSPRPSDGIEPGPAVSVDDSLPEPAAAAKPESKDESRRRNR